MLAQLANRVMEIPVLLTVYLTQIDTALLCAVSATISRKLFSGSLMPDFQRRTLVDCLMESNHHFIGSSRLVHQDIGCPATVSNYPREGKKRKRGRIRHSLLAGSAGWQ
jgi:hypothetical protein